MPGVGLCVCLYDIVRIGDSRIYAGDGSAHTNVVFRLVVFAPEEEEVLEGTITASDEEGIDGESCFGLILGAVVRVPRHTHTISFEWQYLSDSSTTCESQRTCFQRRANSTFTWMKLRRTRPCRDLTSRFQPFSVAEEHESVWTWFFKPEGEGTSRSIACIPPRPADAGCACRRGSAEAHVRQGCQDSLQGPQCCVQAIWHS